jgi:hypothetical protein
MLYLKFEATRVLDPCAGWGDRLVAALATPTVKSYIGIDTNSSLKVPYKHMLSHHRTSVSSKTTVKLLWQAAESVDYSKLRYDFVFTSPPYFTLEKYEGTPTYGSMTHWVATFLKPMLTGAYTHLPAGKYFCINIAEVKNKEGVNVLATIADILRAEGAFQHPNLQYVKQSRCQNRDGRFQYEPILVFQKPAKVRANSQRYVCVAAEGDAKP